MNKVILFYLTIVIVLIGCTAPTKDYIKIEGFAQGTTYSITYYDSLQRNFTEPINCIFESVDSSMSLYRSGSIVNTFNSSFDGIEVDTLLKEVVNLSLKYCVDTDGAFDITIGSLVKAWGFYTRSGEVPDDITIKRLLKSIGSDKLWLNDCFLHKTHPDVNIDVNAIAQGYTVDLLANFLVIMGVRNFLVELGGEIRSSGKSPRGDFWLVGVDKPVDDALSGENLQVIIRLSSESLVTSGNYRKYFVKDGVKYSHTIDPKTGYPVNHSLLSATVLDKTAARADALATAFMVMGKDKTVNWLKTNKEVDAYLIYSDVDGNYQVWMSEGIKSRIVE
jgi:thiamine biosynthesis lipoprotein